MGPKDKLVGQIVEVRADAILKTQDAENEWSLRFPRFLRFRGGGGGSNKEKNIMKEWMISAATILFDDSKNDLRALPKTVRLQILSVLSFIWSTAFTLYFYGQIYADVWTGLVVGHIAIIFAVYYTFKQFQC